MHLKGQSAPEAKGQSKNKKDLGRKAVLISGPPGIGKTSSALIVCRQAQHHCLPQVLREENTLLVAASKVDLDLCDPTLDVAWA